MLRDVNLRVLRPGHGNAGHEASADAARRIDALDNRVFTNPILLGKYRADLFEDTRDVTDGAFVQPCDLEAIAQHIDFLGVNDYSTAK